MTQFLGNGLPGFTIGTEIRDPPARDDGGSVAGQFPISRTGIGRAQVVELLQAIVVPDRGPGVTQAAEPLLEGQLGFDEGVFGGDRMVDGGLQTAEATQ